MPGWIKSYDSGNGMENTNLVSLFTQPTAGLLARLHHIGNTKDAISIPAALVVLQLKKKENGSREYSACVRRLRLPRMLQSLQCQ